MTGSRLASVCGVSLPLACMRHSKCCSRSRSLLSFLSISLSPFCQSRAGCAISMCALVATAAAAAALVRAGGSEGVRERTSCESPWLPVGLGRRLCVRVSEGERDAGNACSRSEELQPHYCTAAAARLAAAAKERGSRSPHVFTSSLSPAVPPLICSSSDSPVLLMASK